MPSGLGRPVCSLGKGRLSIIYFLLENAKCVQQKQVKKDVASFGYNTTIGLAQFHEQVLNRVPPEGLKVKRGRPPIEHTGKRGRPSKAKSTKKAKEAATVKSLGRKPCKKRDGVDWADDEPMEMDVNVA